MPVTLRELQKIIEEEFPGADVSGLEERNSRVTGAIVWPEFGSVDIWERNRLVRDKVRERLGLSGLNVGILLPMASKDEL